MEHEKGSVITLVARGLAALSLKAAGRYRPRRWAGLARFPERPAARRPRDSPPYETLGVSNGGCFVGPFLEYAAKIADVPGHESFAGGKVETCFRYSISPVVPSWSLKSHIHVPLVVGIEFQLRVGGDTVVYVGDLGVQFALQRIVQRLGLINQIIVIYPVVPSLRIYSVPAPAGLQLRPPKSGGFFIMVRFPSGRGI